MADIKFTDEQKKAIFDRGQNILVAASAGSGKTRVLVQRVIEKIKQGTDVDQMLIVTFTDAAANEMKERIQKAIENEIQNSNDEQEVRRYRKQLVALSVANISTIDAFCLQVIRRYYYVIDLDPGFRILTDQAEQEMLKENVWEEVREQYYTESLNHKDQGNDEIAGFLELTDNFSNDRDDQGLTDIVLKAYESSRSNPDPEKWIADLDRKYRLGDQGLAASPLFRDELLPLVKRQLRLAKNNLDFAADLAGNTDAEKCYDKLIKESEKLGQILEELNNPAGTYADYRKLIAGIRPSNWGRMSYPKEKEDKEPIQKLRDKAKKISDDLWQKYFILPEEDTVKVLNASRRLVRKLSEVVQCFADAYAKEKQRRHVLEFNDLEHFSLQILRDEQVQTNLRAKFSEIMIDEYQDTNNLQEAILTSFARTDPGNIFMVGDVKQSIYGFRAAEPGLFLDKYDKYAQEDSPSERVVLAENFRSVRNVDDFTNLIFSQLMNQEVGDMDYDAQARLKFGANYYPQCKDDAPEEEQQAGQTEILIYAQAEEKKDAKKQKADKQASSQDQAGQENQEKNVPEISDAIQGEALILVKRIQELMASGYQVYDRGEKKMRSLKYSDIAILTRTKNNNTLLMQEFSRHEIPLFVNDAANYFQTTEIQIMISMLKVIDNPYQDIPLAAVLRSPIVGLKENDLARIRIANQSSDYYQALQTFYRRNKLTYEEYPDQLAPAIRSLYEKVARFLDQLIRFRTIGRREKIAKLIWAIYNETGLIDYVGGMPGGPQRQANLHALYERASAYEQTSFKGLFQFIRFVSRMEKNQDDLSAATAENTGDAVTVMTIHGSKGLEFPVVCLFNVDHSFNNQDERQSVIFTNKDGAGITYLEERSSADNPYNTEMVKYDTLVKEVAKNTVSQKNQAENMRLLYVALTRAEQKLIIIGSSKSGQNGLMTGKKLLSRWGANAKTSDLVLDAGSRMAANSFQDWIGMTLIRSHAFNLGMDVALEEPDYLQENQADFRVEFITAADLAELDAGEEADPHKWLADQQKAVQQTAKSSGNQPQKAAAALEKVFKNQYDQEALTRTTAFQSVSDIKRLFEDPDMLQMGSLASLRRKQNPQAHKSQRYLRDEFTLPDFMTQETTVSPSEIGTATHLVFQKMPLDEVPTAKTVAQLIDSLVKDDLLTEEVAEKINIQGIVDFYQTALGRQVLAHAGQVKREAPFSLLLKPEELFDLEPNKNYHVKPVLVHGIIDGYVELEDEVLLFDYKTNHLRFGRKASPNGPGKAPETEEEFCQRMADYYSGQLNLYKLALQYSLDKPITHKYLYLTQLGRVVEV